MEIVYSKKEIDTEGACGAALLETVATTRAMFYGLQGELKLIFICLPGNDNRDTYFSCRVNFAAVDTKGVVGGTAGNKLRLGIGSGRSRRVIEQSLDVRPVFAEILPLTDISDGGVVFARNFMRDLFRVYESIMQHIRCSICKSIVESVRDMAIDYLETNFTHNLEDLSKNLLGSMHWPLMFDQTKCGDEALGVIQYTSEHNPIRYGSLYDEPDDELTNLIKSSFNRSSGNVYDYLKNAKKEEADARAKILLKTVCGEELYEQFRTEKYISITKNGYQFFIKRGELISCIDPNGNMGTLCIHTSGLSCHPIDEMIIAYLNIKNNFYEYMDMAVVHKGRGTFKKPAREKADV